MAKKLFFFLIFTISCISVTPLHALDLEVFPSPIEFDSNVATPIQVGLRVFDKGKPIRWDSKSLIGPSSKITVVSSTGESLGLDSSSGLRFIPIGSVDGLTYRLVGVVDRSIKDKTEFQVTIGVGGKPDLQRVLTVTIPESLPLNNSERLRPNKDYEVNQFAENLADIKNTTDTISDLISIFAGLIFSILVAIAIMFYTMRKNDSVTKEVGLSIERLQEKQSALLQSQQQSESYSIKLQQRESHHELHKQGMDILTSTDRVHATADQLMRITNLIDTGIRDFSKNPKQSNEKVKKHIDELKNLVANVFSESESSSKDLSAWITRVEEDRGNLIILVEKMSDNVSSFTDRLDDYDKHIVRLFELISSIDLINNDTIKKDIIETTRSHLETLGIQHNHENN